MYYDAVDLLKQLIAVPSISRDETLAANIVENSLKKSNADISRIGNNIIAKACDFDADKSDITAQFTY